MATVGEIAVSLTGICTRVPSGGGGVCRLCHGRPGPGFDTCWSCHEVTSQLSLPCRLVVPISLYEIPSQLHHLLNRYKSSQHPHLHDEFGAKIISLLAYFLRRHGSCIAEETGHVGWDVISTVPSSRQRSGEHPLVSCIRRVQAIDSQYEDLLAPGPVEVRHLSASDDGFRIRRPLTGERVLLVDDTFTSGARAQSAASVINRAGGDVVAIVPIGRVITPGFNESVKEYWVQQKSSPFSFETCCLEGRVQEEEEWW